MSTDTVNCAVCVDRDADREKGIDGGGEREREIDREMERHMVARVTESQIDT